jgi:hypothetical protein
MGKKGSIDHGLGGKDHKKSVEKRAKKAARQKKQARDALVGGKKKAVVFDEEARTEWLTGFRKRKQERRKHGLAMQLLKDKKEKREKRKANAPPKLEETKDMSEKSSAIEVKKVSQTTVFDDDNTTGMFGGAVSVVVNEGIDFN